MNILLCEFQQDVRILEKPKYKDIRTHNEICCLDLTFARLHPAIQQVAFKNLSGIV